MMCLTMEPVVEMLEHPWLGLKFCSPVATGRPTFH